MKNPLRKFVLSLKNEEYHTENEEKELYKDIIDGVINAQNGTDLKILSMRVNNFDWHEKMRYTYLMGLIHGALMQFNKKVAVENLEQSFKHI